MKLIAGIALSFALANFAATSPLPTHRNKDSDFFYAQQTQLWILYRVPEQEVLKEISPTLEALNLELSNLGEQGSAFLILKPMVFMAEFGERTKSLPGTSASGEVELTVLVHPKGRKPKMPSVRDFVLGRGDRKDVGQLRLDVLCDNEIAVAAGRGKFGEHKFLGDFTYSYPVPNTDLKKTTPFRMRMSAYTWQGMEDPSRLMFEVSADTKDLKKVASKFSPERLYSAQPPEPQPGKVQVTVVEDRFYDNQYFQAFFANASIPSTQLKTGDALGGVDLTPVEGFGESGTILGSRAWPGDMVRRINNTLLKGQVEALIVYKSPSAEYETQPVPVQ